MTSEPEYRQNHDFFYFPREQNLVQPTLDDWHDSTLLDSRWALEAIGIDTYKS